MYKKLFSNKEIFFKNLKLINEFFRAQEDMASANLKLKKLQEIFLNQSYQLN